MIPLQYREYVKATNNIISQYNILLTVRQIFYRLVSSGFIQNTINSYKLFDRMITRGREKGDIDALPPNELQTIIRDAIKAHVDAPR